MKLPPPNVSQIIIIVNFYRIFITTMAYTIHGDFLEKQTNNYPEKINMVA